MPEQQQGKRNSILLARQKTMRIMREQEVVLLNPEEFEANMMKTTLIEALEWCHILHHARPLGNSD